MASDQENISSGSNAVYIGFWIDWDRGKVLGATLTLRDSHAVPLLAALAIVVTLAGNRSWHLCRLIWHSLLRARDSYEQAVKEHRRKQQVILRNSETAGGATVGLFEEWFDFGITRALRKCSLKDLLLGMFAIGHWASFIALGVLVSQIVLGKVVVSKSLPTCGQWSPSMTTDGSKPTEESDQIFNELQLNKTINSDNYVRSCYPLGGSEGRVDCNRFMTQSIPHRIENNKSCPFNATACYPDAKSAVVLESGNMTLSQLGLNTRHGKDISIQRRSTCAVMDANAFKTREFDPLDGFSGTRAYSFFTSEDTGLDADLVFSLRNQFSEDYKLMSMWLIWDPKYIAPTIRPNSPTSHEVSLFLLQGLGIKFVEKQDAFWFVANTEIEYDNATGTIPQGWRRYQMDAFLNVISCTEQFRFCSLITSQCTEFQGLIRYESLPNMPSGYTTLFGENGMKNSSSEAWDFNLSVVLLQTIMQESALPWSIQQRGQAALQASRYLNNGQQIRLRHDQWQFELEYWFMMALARLQSEILNTVDRPVNLDESRATNMWATEKNKVLLRLCGRIKFRSPHHTSLSTFGLIMILVFSGVLMLGSFVGMFLPSIRWTRSWKPIVEWQRDEVLALLEKTKEQNFAEVQDAALEYTSVAIGEKSWSARQQDSDQFDPFQVTS